MVGVDLFIAAGETSGPGFQEDLKAPVTEAHHFSSFILQISKKKIPSSPLFPLLLFPSPIPPPFSSLL